MLFLKCFSSLFLASTFYLMPITTTAPPTSTMGASCSATCSLSCSSQTGNVAYRMCYNACINMCENPNY